MGLPANRRMFLRGMRLLPPRAGMTANLLTGAPSKAQGLGQHSHHTVWLAVGHGREQGQGQRPAVITLRHRAMPRLETQPGVVRMEVYGDVVRVHTDTG